MARVKCCPPIVPVHFSYFLSVYVRDSASEYLVYSLVNEHVSKTAHLLNRKKHDTCCMPHGVCHVLHAARRLSRVACRAAFATILPNFSRT